MKKNSGFTVVELIVSFSLAMAIAVFLFQVVISLKNIYISSGIKTELLNKQSLITNKINEAFLEKPIYAVTKCGIHCLNFVYQDNSYVQLQIDKTNNTISFGDYKTALVEDSYFGDFDIDLHISPVFDSSQNDSLIVINIPIHNDIVPDEKFDIKVVYQFNSLSTNITSIAFDEDDISNGYIVLKGNRVINQFDDAAYVEAGYIVYDENGNVNTNPNIQIENPLTATPYRLGKHEIKYKLLDNSNNVIYTTTRYVTIEQYYALVYSGQTEYHIALNSSFTAPSCQLKTSGGVLINSEDLPDGYTYTTSGSVDVSTLGLYTLNCKLLKDNKIISQYNRNIYVEQEYVIRLDYTGSTTEFTLPATTKYTIELYGAQGGGATYNSVAAGGKGGYSKGVYSGTINSTLYFTIGGKGTDGNSSSTYSGGFNGGGTGNNYSGGGGGATDVKRTYLSSDSTSYRIMVAGGGGGAQTYSTWAANGGAGGGANRAGLNGTYHGNWNVNNPGIGGKVGSYNTTGMNNVSNNTGIPLGSKFYGGDATSPNFGGYSYTGGGGGGYYGGSSGGYHGTSGGGGSGYASSSYLTSIVGTDNINEGNGKAVITFSYHGDLSGYYLRDMPTVEYKYTGGSQSYTTPKTANYFMESWGAQGGNAYHNNSAYIAYGGKGGYSSGIKNVSSGTALYIYVGGNGTYGNSSSSYGGGYNGGGTSYYYSGSGGGATHIATTNSTLNGLSSNTAAIYMAVGGGGGATAYSTSTANGGAGGGYGSGGWGSYHIAANASNSSAYRGGPGTISSSPTTGMYSTSYNTTTYLGTFGLGGGSTVYTYTGGGGGGYYGGAQGGYSGSAGGGGSGNYNGLSSTSYSTGVKQGNGAVRIVCTTCNEKVFKSFYTTDFAYTGNVQQFTVTKPGMYKLEVWGAQGGNYSGYLGGNGGYSTGMVSLEKATQLYILVGGTTTAVTGGYNGGGSGYSSGKGGGGATDIRIGTNSLYNRVIVAGGGGGSGISSSSSSYGHGGGTIGGDGYSSSNRSGFGGTQIAGGGTWSVNYPGNYGSGGSTGSGYSCGGGGAGWYGGGAAYDNDGDADGRNGGGGSGWIYTSSTFSTWQSGNSADAAKWSLNSNYYLTNANTVAGNTSFTSPTGASETGHTGNGYARITYIGDDKVALNNLLSNGSFENTGWSGCTYTTSYKKYGSYSCQLNGTTSGYEVLTSNNSSISLNNTHIYYSRVEGYQTTKTNSSWQTYWPIAEPSMGYVTFGNAGVWNIYSARTDRSSFANGSHGFRFDYNNDLIAGTVYYDGGMLIDLTAAFGAGKEPSKEWCDSNITYFDNYLIIDKP